MLSSVNLKKIIFLGLGFIPSFFFPAQLVLESANVSCEEFHLAKELKIYKDPTLFLSNLNEIYADPSHGWEGLMRENPILTTVKGTTRIMRLGPAREFKNFGAIARLYEVAEPRLRPSLSKSNEKQSTLIYPVKVCGEAYSDSLGFVLASDLKEAQKEEVEDGVLPPSTYPNPVPKLKK